MEKIVKYCAICEENFVEEFSFCPKCSALLTDNEADPNYTESESYQITLVDDKKSKTHQSLLFGAFLVVMSGSVFGLVLSVYNADAYVSALDEDLVTVAYTPIDNATLLKEEQSDPSKEKGQKGGGIGGNEDPTPVSKGPLASQSENPMFAPTTKNVRLTDPEIKIQLETQGVIKRKQTDEKYGDPDSTFNVDSDGPGKYGGQGTGFDRGQGTGKGPGGGSNEGPGIGHDPSGSNGSTNKKIDEEPPKLPKVVTTALKIIDKPRAIYTNEARKNQIAGTVTLRVTFLASGQVGNILVVSGLADGLTEQAIVAAKGIKFEPAKANGISQTITRQVQYTFTLY